MKKLRSEDGAVAVEFALLLPILVVLLLGIMEFGLLYNAQITLTNAAREGARTVAIENDQAAARADVKTAAFILDPALTDADITFSPAGTCAAGMTSVSTIRYEYRYLSGLFGASLTLTGKAAMRCGG
jgi:Flp pilus assembly protein TadG